MPDPNNRRRAGHIVIGFALLTLVFAAVILMGIIDLPESIRLQVAGLLGLVAIADVFIAWRLFLTPRA